MIFFPLQLGNLRTIFDLTSLRCSKQIHLPAFYVITWNHNLFRHYIHKHEKSSRVICILADNVNVLFCILASVNFNTINRKMQNDNINAIHRWSLFINLINSNQTAQLCHRNPVPSPFYWLICLYSPQLKPFSLSKVPAMKSGLNNNKYLYQCNGKGDIIKHTHIDVWNLYVTRNSIAVEDWLEYYLQPTVIL